jgi:hypothetical protein
LLGAIAAIDARVDGVGEVAAQRRMELADSADRCPNAVRDGRPCSLGGIGRASGAMSMTERGGEVVDDGVQFHLMSIGLFEVAVCFGVGVGEAVNLGAVSPRSIGRCR